MMNSAISRRSLLTGTAAGIAGIAAVSLVHSAATAVADEVEIELTGPGTRYTQYPNPDEIGIVHTPSGEEDVDLVVCGTGIGGMMCAMITAEQMPEAKILLIEARGFCGGGTNYAEQNDLPEESLPWEEALQEGDRTAMESHYIMDPRLYAEKYHDQGENSGWLFLKQNIVVTSDNHPLYEGGNGAATIQRFVTRITEEEPYKNIEIRLNTRATALLLDDEYTCTGVQVHTTDDAYINLNAKAVMLCTGGMSNNLDLLQNYSGQDMSKLEAEDQGHFGDGHLMAEQTAHGRCKTIALSSMQAFVPGLSKTSSLSASVSLNPTCCFVNQDGERFIREDIEHSGAADSMGGYNWQVVYSKAIEGQGKVFSIVGSNLMDYIEDKKVEHTGGFYGGDPDIDSWSAYAELEENIENVNIFQADSLEELADMIGVPKDAFLEQVNRYEADAEAGVDDSLFGKPAEYMVPLGGAPYYAFSLKSFLVNTNNGIRVNKNCQVCDPAYKPIEHLYAGGIAISGFNNELYHTGLCQSVSIWSGSKAARHLVENYLGGTVADDWYGDSVWTEGSPLNREEYRKWNF